MRRSLGSRGPGFRGSSPCCAAAVRRPVPAGLSKAPGPNASSPPPSALPRLDPAPPRPAVPPRGAPATPCASAGLQKVWSPYPTAALISGLARAVLLGTEKGTGIELEARTKRQRPERRWRTGENRRERELRRTAVHPLPVPAKGEGKRVGPQAPRALLRAAGWLDPGTQ